MTGNLEAFIAANERDFHKRPQVTPPRRRNISPAEEKAILDLKNDTSIVIKPADKGSAIVILDRATYLNEGYTQLSDTSYYEKLDEDPTQLFYKQVRDAVEDMYQNGEIDESVKFYLISEKVKTARFYLLPKIHKNKIPPPCRPVVSGNQSPTERISQFVDHFLQPCSVKIRSYLKDTNHFLREIRDVKQVPDNVMLVTMDVTALYTNIPTRDGLTAAHQALAKMRPGALHPRNSSLMKLLTMTLKKNNFVFNGTHYLQKLGTAIGTKVAPSFAIIYMGSFEDDYVYTYPLQPIMYFRYIDDVFMIWQHGEEELHKFVNHLNNSVETIKFTLEYSKKSVSFLDTRVIIDNNQIYTDLYTKPTDTHDYLMYSSAHPQRCKDSIPYSQFLRVKRICSRQLDLEKNIMIFSLDFMRRKYPQKLLLKAAEMVLEKDRDVLLQPKEKKEENLEENQIFLSTTFHPTDCTIRTVVSQNWDILGRSETSNFLYKKKLIMSYRRPKNLKQSLIRANLPRLQGDEVFDPTYVEPQPQENTKSVILPTNKYKQTSILQYMTVRKKVEAIPVPQPRAPPQIKDGLQYATLRKHRGFSFCNLKDCNICKKLNRTGTIRCLMTSKDEPSMKKISCRSSNLIYCITCKVCGMQYVGQTMRRLRNRFYNHYFHIRESTQDKAVSRHMSDNNHNTNWNFSISVLEFIKVAPDGPGAKDVRDRVERKWIHRMKTSSPDGMNIDD